MLTCVEGQITNFDPTTIAYYIEGYANTGQLACGHGNAQQPFVLEPFQIVPEETDNQRVRQQVVSRDRKLPLQDQPIRRKRPIKPARIPSRRYGPESEAHEQPHREQQVHPFPIDGGGDQDEACQDKQPALQ